MSALHESLLIKDSSRRDYHALSLTRTIPIPTIEAMNERARGPDAKRTQNKRHRLGALANLRCPHCALGARVLSNDSPASPTGHFGGVHYVADNPQS